MIRANKKHSRRQTATSLTILGILVVIGSGIFWAQFNPNPAVLQNEIFSKPTTSDKAVSLKTFTDAIIPPPPGLVPLTMPERFDARNLSDKINGKAELYLAAGFVGLSSQRFRDHNDANLWLEAFVYDMGSSKNAFAVFSAQRRDGAATLELTAYAYRTQNALFFVHGNFYIEMIASEATARAFRPMQLLAEIFVRTTAAPDMAIQETDLFPNQGLVNDSIALIAADAFGFERLSQVYTAEYDFGNYRIMAFLSRRQDDRAARELASAYQEFLKNFGGQYQDAELQIEGAKLIEILETYEVIFSCGPFLAGVREAGNRQQAINLAVQLYERLKRIAP